MTALDLSPRPGGAPLGAQVLAQAGMETRLLLRNGEQLLLAVVIPVVVLVGAVLGADRIGLDLSLVYEFVVQSHGGTIRFETEEGRGTTFTVDLPVGVERSGA